MTAQTQQPPARKPLSWRRRITRNSKHFNSDDMPRNGRDLTVKIQAVADGKLEGFLGGGKKGDPKGTVFVSFVGIKKPLGLNRTNAGTIEMITGTDIPEDWIGSLITLYVDSNVQGSSGKTEGVRVRPRKPTEQQWLASQAGYKAPPFDLDLALAEIAAAGSVADLDEWRRNLRSVPKDHVDRIRDAWAARKTLLEQAEASGFAVDAPEDEATP